MMFQEYNLVVDQYINKDILSAYNYHLLKVHYVTFR